MIIKRNSKNLKKIIILAIILTTIWTIIFRINYIRLKQWKEPIFMIKVNSNNSFHSTFYGIGYRIETDYRKDGKRIAGSYMYFLNFQINQIVDGDSIFDSII